MKSDRAILSWDVDSKGLNFTLQSSTGIVPYYQWAIVQITDHDGKPIHITPLVSLIENELATLGTEEQVRVPHASIASFSPKELSDLGLPPVPPVTLSLPAPKETIDEDDFHFQYGLYNHEGQPVFIENRTGVMAQISGHIYTLLDPLYSIIHNIEEFSRKTSPSLDEKFALLGHIKELLPPDAVVDPYLQGMNVVFPEGFTLRPYINEAGEVDFDPIPVFYRKRPDEYSPFEDKIVEEPLPPNNQDNFTRYFRKGGKVRLRYPAGGSWYIVFPEPVRKALEIAHAIQAGPVDKRKEFIRNPRIFLREGLGFEYQEEAIERLFSEEGYSDRVRAIGLWQPKIIPWIKAAHEEWLPPESLGFRIGDQVIAIQPEEISNLKARIQEAIKQSRDGVEHEGQRIPANEQVLQALDVLTAKAWPERPEDARPKREAAEKTVLLIRDQIEVLEFVAKEKGRSCFTHNLPQTLKSTLFPHQIDGIRWLQDHWCKGTPGALLADDMGLGKTFTALSFLAWVKSEMNAEQYSSKPILIVAPTGLLKNWQEEHDRHLKNPGLGSLLPAYGRRLQELKKNGGKTGIETSHGVPVLNTTRIEHADWVLTTYETLRDYQHSFGKVGWAVVVFDEAQKIKNPQAAMTDASKAMKIDFAIALTGTPVENRMSDIWCIMDAVQPGKLGSLKEFTKKYESNQQSSESATRLNLLLARESNPPMMMRRMKSDHLPELPRIRLHTMERTMPRDQADVYTQAVDSAKTSEKRQGIMLETLAKLRSISLHPAIRGEETDDNYIKNSARLDALFQVLDTVHNCGEKALIFIESYEMQGYLFSILQRRYSMSAPPLIINGKVSGEKRTERVNIFQSRNGFDAMLLSPKAGGVGLTLTAANHVIHLSRWWNPAVEDQCTDRVYRIGQDREVHVYYPIAVHPEYGDYSFDRRLHSLLEHKRKLSRTIMVPPIFSSSDAEELFDATVLGKKTTQTTDIQNKLDAIDLMEPIAFEQWVLDQLRAIGYQVQNTPRTHDAGADGLAIAPKNSRLPNLIIQCKHCQSSDRPIGREAITEVLKAKAFYKIPDPARLAVATNIRLFTDDAKKYAEAEGVLLLSGNMLYDTNTLTNNLKVI